MAQSARCIALSEEHSLLAFGHDASNADGQVSLVRLDAKGTPLAYSTAIKLPRPNGLGKYVNYVTGIGFHPKLPLLYVWQDINVNYSNPPPPAPAEIKNFDHLHIFNVAGEAPELLVSLCRGPDFIYGQQAGGIAVDGGGSCSMCPIFVRPRTPAAAIRPLSARCSRRSTYCCPKMTDRRAARAGPGKRLQDLNIAKPLLPPRLRADQYVHLFNFTAARRLLLSPRARFRRRRAVPELRHLAAR